MFEVVSVRLEFCGGKFAIPESVPGDSDDSSSQTVWLRKTDTILIEILKILDLLLWLFEEV